MCVCVFFVGLRQTNVNFKQFVISLTSEKVIFRMHQPVKTSGVF